MYSPQESLIKSDKYQILTSINLCLSTKPLLLFRFYCQRLLVSINRRRKKSTTYIKVYISSMNSCFSFSPRSLTMSPNVAKLTQQQANKRWWRRKNQRQQNRVWSNRRRSQISRSIYSFSSSITSQYFSLSIEFYKCSPIALLRMTAKTNKLKTCAKSDERKLLSKTKWFLLLRHHFR